MKHRVRDLQGSARPSGGSGSGDRSGVINLPAWQNKYVGGPER